MCKKLIYLISFVLVLSLAGSAQAAFIFWTNGNETGIWNDPGNWDLGWVPTYVGGAGGAYDVCINTTPGPSVQAAGMGAQSIRMGAPTSGTGTTSGLTIDGGELAIQFNLHLTRYSDDVATVTVNSGILKVDGETLVGREGTATLNMNGGTFTATTFIVGRENGSKGHVNLDGGVITATSFVMVINEGAVGTMDVIRAGTLIIDGNMVSLVQGYIDDPNGWITGYSGDATLQLDYDVTNAGKTTLKTTPHFLNPIPADGSTVSSTLDLLQWTLPETGPFGGVVSCDVYFGTNPSIWENLKIVNRQAVESVSVTLAVNTTYYWAIVLFDSGSSTPDEPYMWWPVFTFNTLNQPPDVNAGDDVDSWLVDKLPIPPDAERVVQLNGIVTDDGLMAPYTVDWTVVSEPNSVTHPAVISDPSIVNPTITMTLPGSYELELAAYDGEHTSSDTIAIRLYDTSCEHAQNQEGFEWRAGDVNHDCKVDFVDIANLTATWLEEYYSTE